MEEERMDNNNNTEAADMNVSETEDLLNNSANISWSRIQKNLDDLNEQDMDEEDENDPPSIHIDLDTSDLLSNDADDWEWETVHESSSPEAATAESNADRANRLIQQSTSIRRVASTRSSSSSSGTARQSGTPPFELDESSSLLKELGRLVLADELKLIIENDEKCAICLEDFRADQLVREINCTHKFHIECIDTWLNTHLNCPVCRKRLSQSLDHQDDLEEEDFDVDQMFGRITEQLQSIIQSNSFSEPGVITLSLDPRTAIRIHIAPIGWEDRTSANPPSVVTQAEPSRAPRRPIRRPATSLVHKRLARVQRRRVQAKRRCCKRRRPVATAQPAQGRPTNAAKSAKSHSTNCAHLNRFRFN